MNKENKYWLHRISHEWAVSYELFEMGYLSMGWSMFSKSGILETAREETSEHFEITYKSIMSDRNKSRWSMWYFAQFDIDDYIVVPMFNGEFSICKVLEKAKPISEIKNIIGDFEDKENKQIMWKDDLLVREGEKIDLGFVIKIKIVKKCLKRKEFADSALTARMKLRKTNGNISDLKESVDRTLKAEKPINFYENVIEQGADLLHKQIMQDLSAEKFELLVKAYMKKIGADSVGIPPKNEMGKKDYADADVIATFDSLKIIIMIQVKFHTNSTNSWGIEQIRRYKEQIEDETTELENENCDEYVNIPWVISTCDEFSNDAIEIAKKEKVFLVNGKEFSKMLLNAGLEKLEI
jgi:hypothetical protein